MVEKCEFLVLNSEENFHSLCNRGKKWNL